MQAGFGFTLKLVPFVSSDRCAQRLTWFPLDFR